MLLTQFPIDAVRNRFPSLSVADDGVSRIYADNPAGTQVRKASQTRQRAA